MKHVFSGHIAGVGTAAGPRLVVGRWQRSPFGAFADVMLQHRPAGAAGEERVLFAPDPEIAEFIAATYVFDRVRTGPVRADLDADGLRVSAPGLELRVEAGGPAPLDRILRWVPERIAVAPWWLRTIDPLAARIVPGVHTAGTAGNGRREYYGVRRSHRIVALSGTLDGANLGGLAPLRPPVDFGFSSAPSAPQLVAVTTTIVEPDR